MVRSDARGINFKAVNAETEIQMFSSIDGDSSVLANCERLGLPTFVQQTSLQPDLRYILISPTLSIEPATGDIYSGLDRFGHVKDVHGRDISAGTDLSRIKYGYDRASNRTWRENPSDPNREHDWLYAYDGLHRLSSAERGNRRGTNRRGTEHLYTTAEGQPPRDRASFQGIEFTPAGVV